MEGAGWATTISYIGCAAYIIFFYLTGKGELKLSKEIMEYLMMYMYGAGSKKFSADKSM